MRRANFIGIFIVACVSLSFYWITTLEVDKLKGLADLQQEIIAEQQVAYATNSLEYKAEITDLYEMLQQQSDTIREQDSVIEAQVQYIEQLETEIDSYDFISGWAYKPWQSKAELKDWLKANDVSEREYSKDYDCDDFSYDLSWDALADERLIPPMRENRHRFNFADVWNDIFEIEPQTDVAKKVGVVD